MKCPVSCVLGCLWVWPDFGQPVFKCSGLYSCIAGESAWYFLFWSLFTLWWSLVSVQVWSLLDEHLSLESEDFCCSQVFDLSLLPLAFSLILTVDCRLLHLYSTDDKTSSLMVKILHSEQHPRWFTELHEEDRTEESEKGDQDQMRGSQREECNLASNQSPKCSPKSGTPRDVHRVT